MQERRQQFGLRGRKDSLWLRKRTCERALINPEAAEPSHSVRFCSFLLEALDRVAGGGDITEAELSASVPSPLLLRPDEKIAWEELSHWIDDDDIRERDPHYATIKRRRMRDHLASLHRNDS